ncbi:DUF222 domain-containing protein [Geodermatophilus sp. SYSU D00691]
MHSTSVGDDVVAEHPSGSPLKELAWAITSGAVRLAAASAAWLRLVAEFDERGGWHGVGIKSCAHWLAWQCGLGPGAAREHVRVARALRELPRIEGAFAAGRLSYSKVRAITRVAAPDTEASLLEFAIDATASQVERFARAWRRADPHSDHPDTDAGGRPRFPAVHHPENDLVFEYSTDGDGFFTLRVRGRADDGAGLMTAIDSLAEREARRERAQSNRARARHEQVRAAGGTVDREVEERCAEDAAVGLARERTTARRVAALCSLSRARVDLDRRPGDPPRREVVVHADAAVLADDTAAGRAYFEGGPAITGATARRLLCEATVVAMISSGREPLAVGRRKRLATKAQRRALLRRDGGCIRPGCPESRIERLHAHHVRHWLHGGRTDLANLVLLCDTDHGLVHDEDLVMSRQSGRLVVTAPDGRRVWGTADATFAGGLTGLESTDAATDQAFAGIAPFDTTPGRRPTDSPRTEAPPADALPTEGPTTDAAGPAPRRRSRRRPRRPALAPRRPAPRPDSGRPGSRRPGNARAGSARAGARPGIPPHRGTPPAPGPTALRARLDATLFPHGAPDLPETIQDRYDPLDVRYAVGVLMGNRDLLRRLAAEAGVPPAG